MSSLPVPPFLNGHVPNGNDKAKLIDALVTFGQWVKQTTDTARQAAEQAAASVNAENIIQRTLARIPDQVTPMRVDVVKTSQSVQVPNGAKAVRLVGRAGSKKTNYGHNMSDYKVFWVKLGNARSVDVVIGATDINYFPIGNSKATINGRVYVFHKSAFAYNENTPQDVAPEDDTKGQVILEWYKAVPEGV